MSRERKPVLIEHEGRHVGTLYRSKDNYMLLTFHGKESLSTSIKSIRALIQARFNLLGPNPNEKLDVEQGQTKSRLRKVSSKPTSRVFNQHLIVGGSHEKSISIRLFMPKNRVFEHPAVAQAGALMELAEEEGEQTKFGRFTIQAVQPLFAASDGQTHILAYQETVNAPSFEKFIQQHINMLDARHKIRAEMLYNHARTYLASKGFQRIKPTNVFVEDYNLDPKNPFIKFRVLGLYHPYSALATHLHETVKQELRK